jgi:hypothetical protein
MQEQNIEKFTSYPSYSCFISVENIDGENLLKIDFGIKDYQIYLNKQLKDKLVNELDIFTRTQYLNRNFKTNDLGFPFNEWQDVQGNMFFLEDTGMMNAASIWLGCKTRNVIIEDDNTVKKSGFNKLENKVSFKNKISLSPDEAEQLKELIKKQWILNDVKELEETLAINNNNRKKFKI